MCCIRYHIPRTFLNPKDNLLVIFEEEKADPTKIEIQTADRDTVCSMITENHPANIKSWASKGGKFQAVVENPAPAALVKCPNHKTIKAVEFASFGDPTGVCGAFVMGKCDAPSTKQIVEQANHSFLSLQNTQLPTNCVFNCMKLNLLVFVCVTLCSIAWENRHARFQLTREPSPRAKMVALM